MCNYHYLFQAQVVRIQKERDSALAEAASCRERVEAAAAAANRAARERDSATTELDVLRERWEKAHQQHQKLTVSFIQFDYFSWLRFFIK